MSPTNLRTMISDGKNCKIQMCNFGTFLFVKRFGSGPSYFAYRDYRFNHNFPPFLKKKNRFPFNKARELEDLEEEDDEIENKSIAALKSEVDMSISLL